MQVIIPIGIMVVKGGTGIGYAVLDMRYWVLGIGYAVYGKRYEGVK
jgi:hypothetical protein